MNTEERREHSNPLTHRPTRMCKLLTVTWHHIGSRHKVDSLAFARTTRSANNKLRNRRLGFFNDKLDQTTRHFWSAVWQQYIDHFHHKQKYLIQAKTHGKPSYQYSFLICPNNTKFLKASYLAFYLHENARPMTFYVKALEKNICSSMNTDNDGKRFQIHMPISYTYHITIIIFKFTGLCRVLVLAWYVSIHARSLELPHLHIFPNNANFQ